MMNRVSSRLAAHSGIRQVNAVLRADAAAAAADRAIMRMFRQALALLAAQPSPVELRHRAALLFRQLAPAAQQSLADSLRRMAIWGHATATRNVLQTVPGNYLAIAAAMKSRNERRAIHGPQSHGRGRLRESRGRVESNRLAGPVHGDCPHHAGGWNADAGGWLADADDRGDDLALDHDSARESIDGSIQRELTEADGGTNARPGLLQLFLRASGLDYTDPLASLRGEEPSVSGASAEELIRRLLFPPLTEPTILRLMNSAPDGPWHEKLTRATRLASPDALANLITSSYSQGKNREEIERDLLPAVNGVRSSARRIARTEGMRIAHAAQMESHEQLGDLVIGYMIHATLDERTRPWHRHRSGTVYYLEPRQGQKGPEQMPNPPEEPRDARERPAGEPQTAYNCRCYLSPVLRPPSWIGDKNRMAVFTNAQDELVPDTAVYSQWFDRTDERRKRLAVGSRRYSTLEDQLGRPPRYEEFIDPRNGDLLPLQRLERETEKQRTARVAKVQAVMAKNEQAVNQLATYGFLLPPQAGTMASVARGA